MPGVPEPPPDLFAGELFRSLAAEGRLVVDAVRADELIAGLERTQSSVQARLRLLRRGHGTPAGELSDEVVDILFADQLAPGRLERAAAEIPKYIEALRVASRPQASSGRRPER